MDEALPNGKFPEAEDAPGAQATAILERFLQDDDWHPQPLPEEAVFLAHFVGEHGEYRCYFQVREELNQFFCYVLAPVRIPEEQRRDAADFLTRANFGLRIGNFEMDFEDGEVRYKSSLDFEGESLTANWLRNAIYPAVYTMDRYLPGLMKVYAGTDPEEAIDEVEG